MIPAGPESTGDDRPPSPEESLAIIAAQRDQAIRTLEPSPAVIYLVWGVAWFVGFGLWHLNEGGVNPVLDLPRWLPGTVFAVLIAGSVAVTGLYVYRASRGIAGPSARAGAMYGWSWIIGFVSMPLLITALVRAGVPVELSALLWPMLSLLLVGIMYLAGGALWQDPAQYGLGVWILATNVVAMWAGLTWHLAVLCLMGGGGFLVAAGAYTLRRRLRSR